MRAIECHIGVDHRSLPLSTREAFAVLHSENALVANRVQDVEEPSKIDFAGARFLSARRIGKLHRAEYVGGPSEQFWHVLAGNRLVEHVEQQSAGRTAHGPTQLGRLIDRSQEHPRRIPAGNCRLEQHANPMSLAGVSTEFQRVDGATKLDGLGNVRHSLAGDDDQIGATHAASRVDGRGRSLAAIRVASRASRWQRSGVRNGPRRETGRTPTHASQALRRCGSATWGICLSDRCRRPRFKTFVLEGTCSDRSDRCRRDGQTGPTAARSSAQNASSGGAAPAVQQERHCRRARVPEIRVDSEWLPITGTQDRATPPALQGPNGSTGCDARVR